MHNYPTLSSIPEKRELDDDVIKWVPKKKHEVLKAKYKCLKKLFQIYDASLIGILPETYVEPIPEPKRRRKRSRRTKTDAGAGTTEVSNGDVTIKSEDTSIPTTVIRELQSQISESHISRSLSKDESTQDSKENVSVQSERESRESRESRHSEFQAPCYRSKRHKPTRFQCFLQRIFGLKPERNYDYKIQNPRTYAASDDDIVNRYEKRRRRGLRLRRGRRPKKIHSEIALRESKSPVILNYVQSVQRNCLMDTTPRQCPIVGCRMMFYGIINYNDHLNLCHFPERRHVCHYCHEGFVLEQDKLLHENEHLGITKLNANVPIPSTERPSAKMASITQTDPELKIDVPEDKLKKIVSFFDKITDPDQIIHGINKNQYAESSLHTSTDTDEKSDRHSCVSQRKKVSDASDVTSQCVCDPVRCQMCGEQFKYRRQLSLHINVDHRRNEKFTKFHSCAGIVNKAEKSSPYQTETESSNSDSISGKCLDKESSTNIVYYTSIESINKKPSVVNSLVQRVRSGFSYKWEPATKIIRV
ncbi:uncharacterized protein LOC119836368 [Zerene cesonia]|uniref:uncharacterized protein LOC119836368 n=1 Tax=Zerene cesonia TaxID=33412 RepID=UPI0018E56F27|nr:uncharacterized protein LOC119836368 [Zerene cesonia]